MVWRRLRLTVEGWQILLVYLLAGLLEAVWPVRSPRPEDAALGIFRSIALTAGPTLMAVAWMKARARADAGSVKLGTLGSWVFLGFWCSAVGHASSAWPFVWTWPGSQHLAVARALAEDRAWAAMGGWVLVNCVMIPIVEETIFRGWLLRLVRKKTDSEIAAVVCSSLLFGMAHLAWFGRSDLALVVNASWLALASVPVAHAVARTGRCEYAVAAHSGRNLAELVYLALFLARSA